MKRFLTTIIMIIIGTYLSACTHAEKAPQPVSLAPIKTEVPVKQLWSNHSAGGTRDPYQALAPVVTYDKIFVTSQQGYVSAFSSFNGHLLWQTKLQGQIHSGPTVGANRVYISTAKAKAVALAVKDGHQLWQVNLPNQSDAAPAYGNKTVVFKTIDGKLVALDSATGKEKWRYIENIPDLVLQGGSSPVITDNVVITGFANGKLVSVGLDKGAMVWENEVAQPTGASSLARMVDIDGDPIVENGVIYVTSYQSNVSAVSQEDGHLRWRHKLSGYSGLAISKQDIFVSDTKGYVWAFDKATGRVLWRQNALVNRRITKPAVIGNYIVVGDNQGNLHWLSQDDGHFVARQFTNKLGIVAPPVVLGNKVIVYDQQGSLSAYTL